MTGPVLRGVFAIGLLTATVALAGPGAAAKDYIVVGTKPNLLFLVDPATRAVVRQYQIPGAGSPSTISTSPDGTIAYVLTDHWGGISGIDLDSGKEVFRTEFSTDDTRIRAIGGMVVSADGKEIFVQQSPTRMLPDEYQVQPTYVAVYDARGGLDAHPVRKFPLPRRVNLLLSSADGRTLYGLGWDLYAFEAKSGSLLRTAKVFNWDRENAAPADILDFWPQYEQTGIFTTPYYYTRTDLKADDPEASKTGILTLDLETGHMEMKDFENTSAIIFSTVVNPMRHSEVFGVYMTLSKIDMAKPSLTKRIDLDHTYYAANISSDGQELYVGGTMNDIAIYSTETLRKIGSIALPGGGDMGSTSMRIVHR